MAMGGDGVRGTTRATMRAPVGANGDDVATQSLIDALASRGVRATGQRRRVLHAIGAQSGIFTAERVCAELPQIGRATVYRTLRLLLDTRAICKVVMPDGEMAYSVGDGSADGDEDSHHHHAVCTVCGSVRDFSTATIERAIAALSARSELGQVVDHRIEVYDICGDCAEKPALPAPSDASVVVGRGCCS